MHYANTYLEKPVVPDVKITGEGTTKVLKCMLNTGSDIYQGACKKRGSTLKEEYKKAKGKTINKILSVFVKFMYNYKLTNVMARPVFITHNHKDINFMAKVVHLFVPMIIYTVDQDSDFVKYQNKVDNIIFEKIDIEKYGKKQTRNSTKSI